MSLTDYAGDFAVEASVPYLNDVGVSPDYVEEKAEKLISAWATMTSPAHGGCCGIKRLNMLVGFFRKGDYEITTPDTARPVTVIATTLYNYVQWWNTQSELGVFKYGFSIDELYLVDEFRPIVEESLTGEWEDRLRWTIHSIPSVGFKGESIDLPKGVLITTSGHYCETSTPRTLPIDYISTMVSAIRVGSVPSSLATSTSDGLSMIADETLSPLKNTGQGQALQVKKFGRTTFDVDSIVQQLKELM